VVPGAAAEGLALGLAFEGGLEVALKAGVERMLDLPERAVEHRGQPLRELSDLLSKLFA
jgi:hypothetical protein